MSHFFPCRDLARQQPAERLEDTRGRSARLNALSDERNASYDEKPHPGRKGIPFRPLEMLGGLGRDAVGGGAAVGAAVSDAAVASAAAAASAVSSLQTFTKKRGYNIAPQFHSVGDGVFGVEYAKRKQGEGVQA